MSVLIETTLGDLVFDLYTDERPRSCLNFLKLCKIKYYNYCLFHSVRRNFIAQSGDPTGSGRGGESIYTHVYGDQAKYFELELKPRIKHRTKGTISFVNNGNDMHGSQFFITLGDGLDFLDGKHTVFGQLAEGFDILEKLNETICDDKHKPYQDVRITHTIILEDPFDDPKDLPIPDRSPEPTKDQLESGRIGADEDINDKSKSKEQLQKELDDKELNIGTKILETVGDIDDADLKPPENVLFVCKLNPITNADDLKIIFSRFGKILTCEIIKDQKTDDSLCYGFVEFKEVKSCEKAYFKMDNVLIDDRRIHVDFCQSVAKIRNKWYKSSMYKTALQDKKASFGYHLKNEKKNEKKDRYSMVFDDDSKDLVSTGNKKQQQHKKVHNKRDATDSEEEEREEEKRVIRKTKKLSQSSSKDKKYRRSPSISESDSDDTFEDKKKLKSKGKVLSATKMKSRSHSNDRHRKHVDPSSSDDASQKRQKGQRRDSISRKSKFNSSDDSVENDKSHSKTHKPTKKSTRNKYKTEHSDEDSESDRETKRSKVLARERSSARKRYDSSSEEEKHKKVNKKMSAGNTKVKKNISTSKSSKYDSSENEHTSKKRRSMKEANKDSTRRKNDRYSSSEDDGVVSNRVVKKVKPKTASKNVKPVSRKKRKDSVAESDTEEYTPDEAISPQRKKKAKRDYSSAESDDRGKKQSRSRRYSSSDDEKIKSSSKRKRKYTSDTSD